MMNESDQRLAEVFGDLALQMQAQEGTTDILRSIVEAAARVVPGARWAGISMVNGKKVVAKVPTSPAVAELDELQTALDEGPCLSALREHHTVHIDDMSIDTRWPAFAREAQHRGIHSLLARFNCSSNRTISAPSTFTAESPASSPMTPS